MRRSGVIAVGDDVLCRRCGYEAGPRPRRAVCVLVGHSYGGMIISEAGGHEAVRSLVYVAAFQPEVGESAGGLQDRTPPAAKSVGPVGGGFVQVKPESFPADFAADVPKGIAEFM